MPNVLLPVFDPQKSYVAARKFRYNGKWYYKGDTFEKTAAPDRERRILFQSRAIGASDSGRTLTTGRKSTVTAATPSKPKDEVEVQVAKSSAPMTDKEKVKLYQQNTKPKLVDMLVSLGVAADPKWTKKILVEEIAKARDGAAVE